VAQAWNYGRGYPTNDDMAVSLPSRIRWHVRAPSGLLLYSIDSSTGQRSFYHYDESGNTMFLTNDAGSVVAEYSYTPFGGVTGLGLTANNPFTWQAAAGAMQVGSSGLFRVGNKVYDQGNAAVISGAGEEVFTDKYGRVKVQFHWDREGKKDEESSRWIRVSSLGGGKDWESFGGRVTGDPWPPPIKGLAVDGFIYFETTPGWVNSVGAGIDQTKKPRPAFEIKDFSLGAENPTTIGSATSGAGSGKAEFGEFTITKTPETASPVFFKHCVAGAHYGKVAPKPRKTGGDPQSAGKPYLSYKFATVFTTKIDWSGPGDEGPEETITFVYGKLGVKYEPQTGDSSSDDSNKWDSSGDAYSASPCMWCPQ
jgi:type VI protein secretion system component Hcp